MLGVRGGHGATWGSSAGEPQISAPVPKYHLWQGVPFQHHQVTPSLRFLPVILGLFGDANCSGLSPLGLGAQRGWEWGPRCCVRDGAGAPGSAPSPRGLKPLNPHGAHPGRIPPMGNGSGEGVLPTQTEGGCLCPHHARGRDPRQTPYGPACARGPHPGPRGGQQKLGSAGSAGLLPIRQCLWGRNPAPRLRGGERAEGRW